MTSEYDGLASALYKALRDDPFYSRLQAAYPDPAGSEGAMLRYFTLSLREAERWGRVVRSKGDAKGAALWSVPLNAAQRAQKAAEKSAALGQVMGAECAECFAQIEANMALHEQALGLDRHWYLSILGVAPDQQGQGVGVELLAPTLAEVDAAGVPSYLTTFTPRNIRFYERMGFGIAGAFAEAVTGHDFHVLIRPPKTNGLG